MFVDSSVFREYDIRGIWNKNIDKDFCVGLGKAFAIYLKDKTGKNNLNISVGYDARLSSKEIFNALCKGLNAEGINVIDIGLVPTPVQYFSLFNLNLDGGVMITASHNPPEYNGFKLSLGKETLYGDQIQEIKSIMSSVENKNTPTKVKIEEYDIIKDYENYMLKHFGHLIELKNKPKVVLDAGNGAGGFIGLPIMKKLGYEVKGIFIEPNGNFPNHHPDPTIEDNLKDLKREISSNNYDIGIGYDGDADRIGVVLSNLEMLYGDQLLLLFAEDIIKKHKNAKIIGEVKCSEVLFDKVKQAGGIPIMYKAGHSLIKSKMKEENALFAGEMSGHIFFADRYFGYDDAIYASLRLLEIMTENGNNLVEWKKALPKTFPTPEIRIDCPDDRKLDVVEKLKNLLEKDDTLGIREINTIDGIRFQTDKGWGLVRASNTQPSLVLRFEAKDKHSLDFLKNKTIEKVKRTIKQGK